MTEKQSRRTLQEELVPVSAEVLLITGVQRLAAAERDI
jgi:hypothetical protein